MIDVGFDLGCGWHWSLGQNLLRLCEQVIGHLVVIGLLVLEPGDSAVLIHGESG